MHESFTKINCVVLLCSDEWIALRYGVPLYFVMFIIFYKLVFLKFPDNNCNRYVKKQLRCMIKVLKILIVQTDWYIAVMMHAASLLWTWWTFIVEALLILDSESRTQAKGLIIFRWTFWIRFKAIMENNDKFHIS